MDFKSLKTFLKVSELHSFSAAAEKLGYSQSAVSTQIANLEKELNTTLFDRIGHKICLTDHGWEFLKYAANVTLLTEEMQAKFADGAAYYGQIRIAMAQSLCTSFFPVILPKYLALYPHTRLILKTGTTSDMFRWLSHNEIDLIFTLDEKICRSEYQVIEEEPEQVSFFAAWDHPLSQKPVVTLADIKQYPVFLTEQKVSYRKLLDSRLSLQNEELPAAVELGDVEVIRQLIEQGAGIGFLPHMAVRNSVREGKICPIRLDGFPLTVWKQLIYHKGKAVTPPMDGLIDLIHAEATLETK
ncbi:MAG: LysR family transcriptional regulator [Clostridiales bacterium]|nr:LysR family transcriptional regulator [Clostridiales bacterium]